jgi:uncharacterized repeat protein (TIGR01451 family)
MWGFRGIALVATALTVALCAGSAGAVEIRSSGPLTTVGITPDLNCFVNHQLDTHPEFYGSTACGTFAVADGELFGPDTVPAGFYPEDGMHTAWTPVDQSDVSGDGSRRSPFTVTTHVTGGPLAVRQVDTYVLGEESFRTDVTVTNTSDEPRTIIFYRGGDCYLGNSDYGFGRIDGDAITCLAANSDGSKGSRIEQFLPITAGSSFYHGYYNDLWQRMRNHDVFPNTCRCDERIDNAAGLSWVRTIAPGESARISSIVTFSPVGTVPITIRKTADRESVNAGDAVGYTVTVVNSNVRDVTLTSLTDQIAPGATYIANSTTGDMTADPVRNPDGSITWNGPFTVPAEGVFRFHYTVRMPDTPGTYRNSVIGEGVDVTVVPAEDVAPVEVGPAVEPSFDISKIADSPFVEAGSLDGYWVTVSNPGSTPITLSQVVDRLPPGYRYILGSSTVLTTEDPEVDGRELTWEGEFVVPPMSAVKLHFRVRTADESGIDPNFATATLATSVPALTPRQAVRQAIVTLVRKLQPLSLRIIAPRRARAGQTVRVVVRTDNPSRVPASQVRTCLRLPRGLAVSGGGRTVCRTTRLLRPRSSTQFAVRARVRRTGLLPLAAAARATDRRPVTATGAIRATARAVRPGITG